MKRASATVALLCLPWLTASAQDLLSVYDQALQRDPTLREAQATMQASEEYRPQAIARLLPQISAVAELDRYSVLSKLPKNPNIALQTQTGGQQANFWSSYGTIRLQQAIYHHDYWVKLSQADNLLARDEANYAGKLQELGTRVAQAYFDVLYNQDSLGFAQAEQKSTERQLEQAKARFDVGLIAITDVNVAQAGYDQATANVIKAENDLDNAKEAMREIVGDFDGNVRVMGNDIPLAPPDPKNLEEWDRRAQTGNFAVIAAENDAEASRKYIDIQFAQHLPTFDIVGSAGFTDNNRPGGIGQETQVIGVQANLPLFQGGAVTSQVRQARHLFDAKQEQLEKQRRATAKAVKNAYRTIVAAIARVAALRAAMVSSQSALEATEAGFEVGTRTMVDVLTEQKNLFGAKRDFAKARYDYVVNSLALKQTSGILTRQDLEMVNRWLAEPTQATDKTLESEADERQKHP